MLRHLIWLNYSPLKHSWRNVYFLLLFALPIVNSLPLVKFTMWCHPYFAETKAERLASSWGFYSGIVGTHHHGFLQNLWDQAHEVHFLDMMMHKEDCMEDYNLGWKFMSYLFKNTLLLCELAKNIRKLNLAHYCFLTWRKIIVNASVKWHWIYFRVFLWCVIKKDGTKRSEYTYWLILEKHTQRVSH